MAASDMQRRMGALLVCFTILSIRNALGDTPDSFSVAPSASWVNVLESIPGLSPAINRPDEGVRFILLDDQVNVSQDEYYHRIVKKITNVNGVQDSVQLNFNFDPSYQRLTIHHVLIHRGTNTVNQLQPEKIKVIQQERDLDRNIYNGALSAVIFLEDVRIGDEIDFSYTVQGSNPILGGRFVDTFTTQWSTPVEYQRFRLLWPASRSLGIKNLGVNAPPTVKQNGAVKEYLWEFRHLPTVTEEDSLPSWYDPYPSVQLSEFVNWKEVAEWEVHLYPRPIQLAPELVEKINTWQHLQVQPEAQLASVLQFVQDEIRYLGIEFGPNSHQPSDPSTVFTRRFGDCKDKAYLLCTILQQLNIDASVALVHTEYRATIADWLPSPYAFDHVIVHVCLNGKTYWLDPTESHQGGPVDNRYFPNYGRCLLVQPEATGLTVIPQQKSGWPTTTVQETFIVHGRKEPAAMTVHTRAEGLDADRLRAAFANDGRNELEKRYLNFYARDYPKIKTTRPLEVLDHSEQNVFETFEHYQIQEFWTLSDDHRNYECEFYPRIIRNLIDEPTTTLRSMPLAVGYPRHEILQTKVILPEPWPVKGKTNQVSTTIAQLTTERTVQKNVFWLKYEYQSLTNCVLITNVPAYLKSLNQMKDMLGYSLTWANEEFPASAGTNHLNWTIVFLAGIYMILLAAGCVVLYRLRRLPFLVRCGEEPPILDPQHTGLGGWLVLPALGLFASPIRILFFMGNIWSVYSPESWHSLTDPSGSAYHGLWAPLLIYELLVNLTLMSFPIFLIILFFQRRRIFPPLFVIFLLFAVITITLDHFGSQTIPAVAVQNNGFVSRELIQSYMACAIWVPYMLVSKRVKATFVL